MVVVVEEDVDFSSNKLVGRLKAAFDYSWMAYDMVETLLPKGSEKREWLETEVCWKIENVVGEEGEERVERPEPKRRWDRRIKGAGFGRVVFGDDAVAEVKNMLEEHSGGWGLKEEEEVEDGLVLTWKGHSAVFATAWAPVYY